MAHKHNCYFLDLNVLQQCGAALRAGEGGGGGGGESWHRSIRSGLLLPPYIGAGVSWDFLLSAPHND